MSAQDVHKENLFQIAKQPSNLDTGFQLKVGNGPKFINDIGNEKIYVVNEISDTVSVISTENDTKIKDIAVGDGPRFILDSILDHTDTDKIYVANYDSNSISVINITTDTKIGPDISVGGSPASSAFAFNKTKIYVANSLSNTVSVINITTDTKIGPDIPVGGDPVFIANDFGLEKIYVANYLSDTVSVISTENDTKIKDIAVGDGPRFIIYSGDKIYVANGLSNTTSVINIKTDTKIGPDIPVGGIPVFLEMGTNGKLYVANAGSDNISVINTTSQRKIGDDIPVGSQPVFIAGDVYNEKIYVVNSLSNNITVISTENDTKIKDIPVGVFPIYLDFNPGKNAIYVANYISNSISMIDRTNDEAVGRLFFEIVPTSSGSIKCGDIVVPIEKSFYLNSGIGCKAIPNKGFEFLSWEENLGNNATQLINASEHVTGVESILDFFGIRTEEPEATLNFTTFGSFTANFKELPSPLPAEYWATLFGFVLTTGLGAWLIPSLVRWTRSRADTKKSNYYHQRMKSVFDDNKLDEKDIDDLDDLEREMTDARSKGKINEVHYSILKNEISMVYEEIFKNRIESLNEADSLEELQEIGKGINDAHSKGKINEIHYSKLKEEISKKYDKMFRKNIYALMDSYGKIRSDKLLKKIQDDIEIAHSEQKITETQFNLLKDKISNLENKGDGNSDK